MHHFRKLIICLLLTLTGVAAELQAQALPLPGPVTHTAKHNALNQSGNWNDPKFWVQGTVPGPNSIVRIPAGIKITVTSQQAALHKFIQVDGELWMSIHSNTLLRVETMQISSSGLLRIGFAGHRQNPNRKARIEFASNLSTFPAWDPDEKSLGLFCQGDIEVFGARKTAFIEANADFPERTSILNPGGAIPGNWAVGDSIVITNGYFRRGEGFRDEVRVITAKTGSSLTLNSPLTYEHRRVANDMPLHIANLSRNVIFYSEASSTKRRGHVMITQGGSTIEGASFIRMGRTDKNQPLDDVDNVTGLPNTGTINNRRGRYALHFHLNGTLPGQSPPTKVKECVARDAVGWGFVNHGSHVSIRNNVAYNFVGSGFVTEQGDELGDFFQNIAIRGTGNGEYRDSRIVFQNRYRQQPLGDFGFSGDGFWFQGPAIKVHNNVASSCNGSGMIWFATGQVIPGQNQYLGFPSSQIATVYAGHPGIGGFQGRTWKHAPSQVIISDLPILQCDTFQAYGCLAGFRLRFNNFDNNDLHHEDPVVGPKFPYEDHIQPIPGQSIKYANRLRQKVSHLKLWNNEIGLRNRYNSKTDFEDIKIVNRLDYALRKEYFGAEFFFRVEAITFRDLSIDGYEVAGIIGFQGPNSPSFIDNSSQVTFINGPTYSNYALKEDWIKQNLPATPVLTAVSQLTKNSARINWVSHPSGSRFLCRYRRTGTKHWSYATAIGSGATFVNLSGLSPSTTYEYQVTAGTSNKISKWSNRLTFTTPFFKTLLPGVLVSEEKAMSVAPNPTLDGRLSIRLPEGEDLQSVYLLDLQGRELWQAPGRSHKLQLPASIAKGVYFLKVQSQKELRHIRIMLQ